MQLAYQICVRRIGSTNGPRLCPPNHPPLCSTLASPFVCLCKRFLFAVSLLMRRVINFDPLLGVGLGRTVRLGRPIQLSSSGHRPGKTRPSTIPSFNLSRGRNRNPNEPLTIPAFIEREDPAVARSFLYPNSPRSNTYIPCMIDIGQSLSLS